ESSGSPERVRHSRAPTSRSSRRLYSSGSDGFSPARRTGDPSGTTSFFDDSSGAGSAPSLSLANVRRAASTTDVTRSDASRGESERTTSRMSFATSSPRSGSRRPRLPMREPRSSRSRPSGARPVRLSFAIRISSSPRWASASRGSPTPFSTELSSERSSRIANVSSSKNALPFSTESAPLPTTTRDQHNGSRRSSNSRKAPTRPTNQPFRRKGENSSKPSPRTERWPAKRSTWHWISRFRSLLTAGNPQTVDRIEAYLELGIDSLDSSPDGLPSILFTDFCRHWTPLDHLPIADTSRSAPLPRELSRDPRDFLPGHIGAREQRSASSTPGPVADLR